MKMKTESFKTLEVGRKYLTRVGKVVKIKSYSENSVYPFKGDNGYTYTAAGFTWVQLKSGHDLISRIVEPTTLTIQRWGVLWRAEDNPYRYKVGQLLQEHTADAAPTLFKTRKNARHWAKYSYGGLVNLQPPLKPPKAVKVKCTYEVIE